MGRKGNPFTKTFVDNAITVWNRFLSIPKMREMALTLDDDHPFCHPFSTVNKTHIVVWKAKTHENIVEAATHINDVYRSGARSSGELGSRALSGASHGGRGLVDVFLRQRAAGNHMLNVTLDALNVDSDIKIAIRSRLSTWQSYRAWNPILPAAGTEESPSYKFMMTWAESDKVIYDAIENVLYSSKYEDDVRNSLKEKKSVEDVLDYPALRQVLDEVQEMKKNSKPGWLQKRNRRSQQNLPLLKRLRMRCSWR